MPLPPPRPTLFPYTPLFRSRRVRAGEVAGAEPRGAAERGGRADVSVQARRWKSREREPDSRHASRSEEHTSELQSQSKLVCRLLLEKKKKTEGRTRRG